MVHLIKYKAEYECPNGHVFTAEASPMKENQEVMCAQCFSDFLNANIPKGKQITKAVETQNYDNLTLAGCYDFDSTSLNKE